MKKEILAIMVICLVFCLTVTANAANLVANPGFETVENTSGGPPSIYGDWNGDYSAIIGTTSGITPLGGSKMLQFKGTSHNDGGSGNSCEIFQIVDITSCLSLISSGSAVATASAYFNRVAGDAQTDTAFNLILMAYDGSPSTFPSRWNSSTYDSALTYCNAGGLLSDGLVGTWEQLDAPPLNLPTSTTFLVIDISASEDVFNDYSYPEFDGHFADNISLQVVPEPATMILLGLGTLLTIKRKYRYVDEN
jgi:hypothetical protein